MKNSNNNSLILALESRKKSMKKSHEKIQNKKQTIKSQFRKKTKTIFFFRTTSTNSTPLLGKHKNNFNIKT